MSLPAAYLGVILIWSTTPLAIKWSAEGSSFAFGVFSRMVIGVVLCWLLMAVLRLPFHRDRAAWRAYVAGGLGLSVAMLSVYWASRYIPSGLISVLFGLTPLLTGLLAHYLLDEVGLTLPRIVGMALGLSGLGVIFADGMTLGEQATVGLLAVLLAVTAHSLSAVVIKRIASEMNPLTLNTGILSVALIPFGSAWLLADGGQWPAVISVEAAWAILYLGVFGSAIGFVLYFYSLKRLPAGVIALITLITPVIALLIGSYLNGEEIPLQVWLGSAVIICGLLVYQWGGKVAGRLKGAPA